MRFGAWKYIIRTDMTRDGKQPISKGESSEDSLLVIAKTLGDTTWRMFVPVIVGALVGFWIGGNQAAVIGSVVGLAIAGLLVWQQYARVTKGSGK